MKTQAHRNADRPRARSARMLRIIGGEWRGRRIRFTPRPGLRPTPDRVRETLFNWLQPVIHGARCLDLFAGSGALGFEAASRGATTVTLVEQDPRIVVHLRGMHESLDTTRIDVVQADARQFVAGAAGPYDVVFLDPPFAGSLMDETLELLAPGRVLGPDAVVYMEYPAPSGPPGLPRGWSLRAHKVAGAVGYCLARTAHRGSTG